MEYQLTENWQIRLPDGFQRRKEGAHGIFWTPGLTMITTVFHYEGESERQALLENLRDKALSEGHKTIEDAEDDEFEPDMGGTKSAEFDCELGNKLTIYKNECRRQAHCDSLEQAHQPPDSRIHHHRRQTVLKPQGRTGLDRHSCQGHFAGLEKGTATGQRMQKC